MKLQTLVSTMSQKDHSLVSKMNIRTDSVVINQCGSDSVSEILLSNGDEIKWINSSQKGLSRSRNLALESSSSDICMIADDDLVYRDDVEKNVIEAFENHPDVDIIVFCIKGIEKNFKKYDEKERNINYLSSMKISSVEIAFKLNSLKENNIKFNEHFGAGSTYFMGEENIFLFECLRKNLKIRYVPIYIADLHIGNSSWFKGFNKEYLFSRGAVFYAMTSRYWFLLTLQFLIRKYRLYSEEISFFEACKAMIAGKKDYEQREKSNM